MSNEPWLNSSDKERIARYLIGGAALGTTTGIATGLINHLKSLNTQAARKDDTSGDDDILYLNVPKKKGIPGDQQEKLASDEPETPSHLGNTLALAGLPLAALGSHALVQKLYANYKKKQLQAELDSAQNMYIDELAKSASGQSGMGLATTVTHALPAAALLVALASGVLTNKTLDKQFPQAKSPMSNRPKRLVVRETPYDEEGMIKEQSINDDAYEGLLRTVLELPDSASKSGLGDLVKAAAAGRTEEILRSSDVDPDLTFDLVKGASSTCQVKTDLAIGWLIRDPETAEFVKLSAALEFFENKTGAALCAFARQLPEELHDDLIKSAAAFCAESRKERYAGYGYSIEVEKQASSPFNLVDALGEALVGGHKGVKDDVEEGSDERDPELVLGNSTSVASDSAGHKSGPLVQTRGANAKKFSDTNKDMIDDIFSPQKPEDKAK